MKIEMHLVADWDNLRNGGDYIMASRHDGSRFPIIVCPKCLKPCGCSKHTLVQETPLTIRASFLCAQRMPDGTGTCGWHGWITAGFMEAV